MASEAVGYACLDGAIVPLSEGRIPVTDDGLLRDDGGRIVFK